MGIPQRESEVTHGITPPFYDQRKNDTSLVDCGVSTSKLVVTHRAWAPGLVGRRTWKKRIKKERKG
jgi:hypothetical protein